MGDRAANAPGRSSHAATSDAITIDDSSPWDGPHPGLEVGPPSTGSRRRRSHVGMVKLPASLVGPKRRTVRAARPATGDRGPAAQAGAGLHSRSPADLPRSDMYNDQRISICPSLLILQNLSAISTLKSIQPCTGLCCFFCLTRKHLA